jgi:hypothetical protein
VAGRVPQHQPADQHRAQPELDHGVLELGDRLIRCVRRDHRNGEQPICVVRVDLGVVAVARARDAATHLLVVEGHRDETERRVEDGEIEADLVEPLVQEARQHRRGAVEGVARRHAPPARPRHAGRRAARSRRAGGSIDGPSINRSKPAPRPRATELDHEVAHEREELHEVAVAVDDGMVEPGPDRVRVHEPGT